MRALVTVAVLWVLCGPAPGQSGPAELYNQANRLYRQGEFAAARDRYLQAAEGGVQDPRLYYNLGNACFKSGRLGEAVLWYERALRLAPRDSDIRANLRFVGQVKKDREDTAEGNPLWQFLVKIYLFPTLNELCLLFSLLLFLSFSLAAWRLWNREKARTLVLALFFAGAGLTLLSGAWLGGRLYRQAHRHEAVVTSAEATARSGPDENQTAVFVVHEGTKLRLERSEGAWVLARLPSGLGGWVPASALSAI